jgi:hypothetical protein
MPHHQPFAKFAAVLLLGLAALSVRAGTVLESPRETTHRTRQMLDIKATLWEVKNACFSGLVEAQNQSSRDARLHVVISGGGSYRKSVVVPAGQTVRFPVYAPIFNNNNNWRGYQVGFRQDGDSETYDWASFSNYGYSSGDIPLLRPRNPADLPVDPRLYWGFTTLSLTPEQWTRLDAPRREAILAWVEIGGHLFVSPLTAKILRQAPPSIFTGPAGGNQDYGLGAIHTGVEPEQGITPAYLTMNPNLEPSWQVGKISAWVFIPFVVIFALILGPGTIWYSHRRNRPALTLLIIPAVSLTACLLILLFSLLHDGVTPKVCRETLTLLDQRSGNSLTGQIIGIEAPLGLFGPVVFPEGALVHLPKGNTISPRCEVVGGELHIRSAVLARTPTFFMTLHREQRRERLDVRRDGNRLLVTNGLGAPVERLLLRDAGNALWRNPSPIPPGSEVAMEPCHVGSVQEKAAMQTMMFYRNPIPHLVPTGFPVRGGYLATLGGQAFGVSGIEGGRTAGDAFNVVAGRYE